MLCCTFRYSGFANPDQVAAAANLCLQAYFEGRDISADDVQRCLEYWEHHISEEGGGPKRDVCCEPHCQFPCASDCSFYYRNVCHPRRMVPYEDEEDVSDELKEVYRKYDVLRRRQSKLYEKYQGPVRSTTWCRKCGCRRFFGRKGCIFCTEGCNHFDRKSGDPAPPFDHRDIDDECDASVILRKVLGPPPDIVVYRRWEYKDESSNELVLATYAADTKGDDLERGGVQYS